MTFSLGILAILPLFVAPSLGEDGGPNVANLDQHDLQIALARLATEHPNLVTVVPVGESRGKRRIEALRVAAGDLVPGRPAILVVANVDGPLVWTSGLVLDHARQITARYATDATVKALLDTTTIYFVPRVDCDAAEARFATPLFEERASGPGIDDDRDGRQGEDPPSDVDGDGLVTWMRVPDPKGEWMPDPTDARACVKADHAKGQHGIWKLVREGRDSDKDGEASEDRELDTVLNCNFPQGWKEHGAESGRFATEEPGARALCDFVLSHKDIALVLTYGMLDDVSEKPKSESKAPRQSANPSDGIPDADAALYAELGRRFKDLGRGAKGEGDDRGTFQAWVQAQRGLWTVNIAPWSIPLDDAASKSEDDASKSEDAGAEKPSAKKKSADKEESDKPSPSDDAKRLRWIDAKAESARFVPWKTFAHPELGNVEIGGFAPYALLEPPAADRSEIASKNVEFLIALGGLLPRVKLVDVTARDLASGTWEVKAVLANESLLPLPSALGLRTGVVRPARVSLVMPKGAQILAGNSEELVRSLDGSGGRAEFRWLVRGAPPSALEIVVDTDQAGTAHAIPEVK